MSRSFTQEYVNQKIKTKKKIKEINVPKEILPMIKIVEKSFNHKKHVVNNKLNGI
ncbi:MAG: hypothetical protein LBT10_00090 [Methanobrevibacter sp.]|jgi:hypothetical protein|nr:hypothetical protein [Methanobrevibacter sp.]